jgi:hypothetical protein
MTKADAGKLGGLSTVKKYGQPYMAELAKKGAQAFHKKYMLVPYGQDDFSIVNHETGQPTGKTINGRRIL